MSQVSCLVFAVALLMPALAMAQSALEGTWEVDFSTHDSETRRAVVRIAGSGGTWTTVSQPGKEKNDPCVGRAFPVTVVVFEPKRLVLEVAFSKVVAGCKDRTVTGQLEDSGVVEGKLENGKPVRMVKQ